MGGGGWGEGWLGLVWGLFARAFVFSEFFPLFEAAGPRL